MPRTWDEICEDKSLRDLPYKVETNRHGQVILSRRDFWCSSQQGQIAVLIHEADTRRRGEVSVETAIQTTEGFKVADVAWASRAFFEAHRDDSALTAAPEICVELLSEANNHEVARQKLPLYFFQGAKEVWLCNEEGRMIFYHSPTSELPTSAIFPNFPSQI